SERAARPLRELGKAIVDPALRALHREGVRTLLIAPDGELSTVPFEALLMEEDAKGAGNASRHLVERYAVAYVHSGTTLREQLLAPAPVTAGGRKLVAFAHPAYR